MQESDINKLFDNKFKISIFILIIFSIYFTPASASQGNFTAFEKIETDLSLGAIDYETALKYKIYLLFDPEKLPIEYQTTKKAIKCGTPILIEVQQNWDNLSSQTQNELIIYLQRPNLLNERTYQSPGGHFLIHYTVNGANQVPIDDINGIRDWRAFEDTNGNGIWDDAEPFTDTNGNGLWDDAEPFTDANNNGAWDDAEPQNDDVGEDGSGYTGDAGEADGITTVGEPNIEPDYVENYAEYFDTSWSTEIDVMSYDTPPSDGTAGGGNDLYDIYINSINAYGVTTTYINTGISFIQVNIDYSWVPNNDNLDGRERGAMKVTAAHEFFHAIQGAYDTREELWWMETTAVWMEDEVYDNVNDNYNYLGDPYIDTNGNGVYDFGEPFTDIGGDGLWSSGWFSNPDLPITSTIGDHEYGNFIFAKYLSEHNDGIAVIQDIWNENRRSNGLTSIGNVLSNRGTNLEIFFINFVIANYLHDFANVGYEEGNRYPDVAIRNEQFNSNTLRFDYSVNDWASDYYNLVFEQNINNGKLKFNGIDTHANFAPQLITIQGSTYTTQSINLDENNYGSLSIENAHNYNNIVLAVPNAGDAGILNNYEVTLLRWDGELQEVSIPKSCEIGNPLGGCIWWHDYNMGDVLPFKVRVRNTENWEGQYQISFAVYDENNNLLHSWDQSDIIVPAGDTSDEITLVWPLDANHGVNRRGIYKVRIDLWQNNRDNRDVSLNSLLYEYKIVEVNCEDKYDVKFWFTPGTGTDTSDSDPAQSFTCTRTWVDHLGDSYWGEHHNSLAIFEISNLDIRTDKETYTIGEPISFNLSITNTEDTSRIVPYTINLESKDPEAESALREVHQTLTGELTLVPGSADYDITSLVPVLPFDRIIYAVAEVEGNNAVTTFEIRPSFELSIDYNLIEGEAGTVNLTINNTDTSSIIGMNVDLETFPNVEVPSPTQTLSSIAPGEIAVLEWSVNTLSSGYTLLSFDISTDASGSGKIRQLVEITAKPRLMVEADSIRINLGDSATITANVTNLGDIGLDNVVAELRLEDGLPTSDPSIQTIGALEGQATAQVSWTITGSDFGDYLYSVYAEGGDINATDIETITIVEEGHDVDLKVDGLDNINQKNTFIQTPVDYTIDVTNTGTNEDTIDVYVFPDGINWTTILYDSGTQTTTSPHRVTVPAGSTYQLNLQLTPYPQVAIGEEFNVDIQIVSEKDTLKVDRGIAQAVVVSETGPILVVNPTAVSKTIDHNSQETFTITVKNDGLSVLNNVELASSGTIASWISLSQNNITSMDPGDTINIDVTISVPKYQAPDIYGGKINFNSDNGGTANVQISVDVPASYEVVSSVDPTYNSAVPGDTASYYVTVKNEGNVVDRYAPVVENSTNVGDGNISQSWVSANKTNITLNPGISDTVTLDIMPPRRWSTLPGIYNYTVNVSSQNTYDTNEATLEVLNFSEVDIEITSSQSINPPETPIDPDLERIIKENPSGKVKVIIKTKGKPGSAESTQIEKEGGKIKYTYNLINGIAAEVPNKKVEKIASKSFVESIELDKEVHAFLDISVPALNVSYTYGTGLDGTGVDVAVLDTGIDHDHPAFASIGWEYDFVDGDNIAEDQNGHGTHVAGIIASNNITYRGLAPGATIMPIRVLDEFGVGNSSDVIAGIEWAVDHGAEIISMSLGGAGGDGTSALSQASDSAVARGVTVVVAAGNDGPDSGTIASPGDARNVITVGAVNDTGVIAYFSSRGPTIDNRIKPDIVAPGVNIISTKLNGGFVSKSGTSMSTPHVSGAIALLIQAYQSDPMEIKEAVTSTAKDLGYDNNTQGVGMIDVDAACLYLKELNNPIVQDVRPGGKAIYNIELTNLGNIYDTFNITTVPQNFDNQYYAYPTIIQDEWIILNSSLVAYPGEQIDDNANIIIPSNWAGMEDTIYNFKIKATSETDSSATDEIMGKLVINPTKRSMVEYTGLEIHWLSDYINSLPISDDIKNSLLDKTVNASEKNDQALNFLLKGDEILSNNMLGAEYNMINALISEVEAQSGKGLSISDAEYIISKAELIKANINKAIITPS